MRIMHRMLSISVLFFCYNFIRAAELAVQTPTQADIQSEQSIGQAFLKLASSVYYSATSAVGMHPSSSNTHVPLIINPPQEGNKGQEIHVHFNNNNSPQMNQFNNQQTHTEVKAEFKNLLQQCTSTINPRELANAGGTFLRLHKKRVVLGTIATTYASINLYLVKGYYFLTHQAIWASWKKHMTTEELIIIPQPELQKTLRQEILNRYLINSKDRLTSYMHFMKAIEQEEKQISRYVHLGQLIKKSRLIRFFSVNDKKIRLARKKRKRLGLVKGLFISWAAEQNFEKV